jgi:hypothetical protein
MDEDIFAARLSGRKRNGNTPLESRLVCTHMSAEASQSATLVLEEAICGDLFQADHALGTGTTQQSHRRAMSDRQRGERLQPAAPTVEQ